MRLLNTDSKKLHDWTEHIPLYTILSHCWGTNEIIYADFEKYGALPLQTPENRDSFEKITKACDQTKRCKYEWIWIDTICINKDDLAELDRSIRSMYRWYKQAAICFAYLHDATKDNFTLAEEASFRKPKWFTRGWTLQEMLAPQKLNFFDGAWNLLDSRDELASLIERCAGISRNHLSAWKDLSVATKMSWAANRETRDEEDRAYSLMGIFDVSIDVRYGEGAQNAFLRLQEAILHNTPDESLFAWTNSSLQSSGLLATSIECFRNSGDIILRPEVYRPRGGEINFTNGSLKFPVPYYLVGGFEFNDIAYAWSYFKAKRKGIKLPLYCWRRNETGKKGKKWQAITLKLQITGEDWVRTNCDTLFTKDRVKTGPRMDPQRRNLIKNIRVKQKEITTEESSKDRH